MIKNQPHFFHIVEFSAENFILFIFFHYSHIFAINIFQHWNFLFAFVYTVGALTARLISIVAIYPPPIEFSSLSPSECSGYSLTALYKTGEYIFAYFRSQISFSNYKNLIRFLQNRLSFIFTASLKKNRITQLYELFFGNFECLHLTIFLSP